MALSSLFGIGGARQRPATTQVVQSSKLPEEISPYAKEVLDEAKELYKQRMEAGYDPYTGATIAPLTPEQREAYAGIKGLVGTTAPLQREALEGIRGGRERFDYGRLDPLTGDYGRIDERLGPLDPTDFTKFQEKDVTEYMSPYERAVTRTEKREAQRDFERRIMPEFEARATEAGGMSGLGTRAGVEASELARQHAQRLGDIETSGLQRAYQDAQARRAEDFQRFQDQRSFEERQRSFGEREREFARGERAFGVGERAYAADLEKGEREFMRGERTFDAQQFAAQKAREAAVAQQVGAMGPAMFTSGLAEQGALQTIGEQKQNLGQQALDEAYFRHLEKQAFPQEQLAGYSGFVYGNPLMQQRDVTATGTQVGSKPSLGQQILGLGMQGLNMYRNPGPTMPQYVDSGAANRGVRLGVKGGGYLGGLSSLPVVRRAENGSVDPKSMDETIEFLRTSGKNPEQIIDYINENVSRFKGLETGPERMEKYKGRAAERAELVKRLRPTTLDLISSMGSKIRSDPDSQGIFGQAGEALTEHKEKIDWFNQTETSFLANELNIKNNVEDEIQNLPKKLKNDILSVRKAEAEIRFKKSRALANRAKAAEKKLTPTALAALTDGAMGMFGLRAILNPQTQMLQSTTQGKILSVSDSKFAGQIKTDVLNMYAKYRNQRMSEVDSIAKALTEMKKKADIVSGADWKKKLDRKDFLYGAVTAWKEIPKDPQHKNTSNVKLNPANVPQNKGSVSRLKIPDK